VTGADHDHAPRVTVVTGPLGAGKTTLLNRWLEGFAPGEVAVIVNEFGDVGVDGDLLAARAREVVELTGGCVCCTTRADLVRALLDLAGRTPAPRRVFVETSGAASPAAVVRAVTRGPVARRMRLDGVVTAEQVAYADVIVLTRADVAAVETFERAELALAARNPTAAMARAARGGQLTPSEGLDALLARRSEEFSAPWVLIRPADAPHDVALRAVSLLREGVLHAERFASWIERVVVEAGGRLMRLKGIVAVEGVPMRIVLQGVGDAVEVSFGPDWAAGPRRSRVVLIGVELDEAGLQKSFDACAP
jgi:G3E family GTPase